MRIPRFILQKWKSDSEFDAWRRREFASPAPHQIKMRVLKTYGSNQFWIETGTFFGRTSLELSVFSKEVHTIEPSEELFLESKRIFGNRKNIYAHHGLSEELLGPIIDRIIDKEDMPHIDFWLDGHFSQGVTFRGEIDTPVIQELRQILKRTTKLSGFTIFVDDVRLFSHLIPCDENYPKLFELVAIAKEYDLLWTIEHDILIITSK